MTSSTQLKTTQVHTCKAPSADTDISPLLDRSNLKDLIPSGQPILIKPNLVEAIAPPVTTPVNLVEQLVQYMQINVPDSEITIGDGTGSLQYDTFHPMRELGYVEMARKNRVNLIDLNTEPLTHKNEPKFSCWQDMYLPTVVFDSFVISVPVLKAHTLATVTLTMKNMMGCAPPAHFQDGNSWGKSAFHQNIQAAVFDLNQYRTPDFTVLDATVGMAEAHLWGATCNPPPQIIAASSDPVAIDSFGAALLHHNWQDIGHIRKAHNILGLAEPLDIVRC